MNWKNITIIVLVGVSWTYFVNFFIATSFYDAILNALATCFIGSIIAGRLSTADAWKNGLCVGIFLYTVGFIVSRLFMILGLIDLSLYNLKVIGDLMIFAIVGAIGGFIGGKIKFK